MADDPSGLRGMEWGDPIPLDSPGPPPPPFPLFTLPRPLQDLCAQSAEAVGCPVDYPAGHVLAVAAGAVGASYDLQVKRGHHAPAALWVCVVAPPGSGKSPAAAPVLAPVYREHARRLREDAPGQVFVSDVTTEKLAQMLCDNERGLLMVWDEMAGWLTGFNQYKGGKGNDRAHYLSIWDGRPVKVDRKGKDNPPIFVRRPRLSLVGGIQPGVLDALRAGPEDGLFDRMLFVYPPEPGLAVETWAEVDDAPCDAWAAALRRLWDRPLHEPGLYEADQGPRPNVIVLADEARPRWQAWTRELADRAADKAAPPYVRKVAAKVSGYTARLALVVHLLREAYGEAPPMGVGPDDVDAAVGLATYFLGHAERVYRPLGRDPKLVAARVVLDWARGFGRACWTRSDAWASLRNNALFGRPGDLDEPIRLLVDHRLARPLKGEPAGPGRPTTRYELNPKAA